MADDRPRTRSARAVAERALIRVVHHYGARPEFVLIGGLVPDLLCAGSAFIHSGTTDVDVQVNLEIAAGADVEVHRLRARVGGVDQTAEVNVTGLAGYLLAKCAA